MAGCSRDPPSAPPPDTRSRDFVAVMEGATPLTSLQRVEYALQTPPTDGEIRLSVLVDDEVRALVTVPLRKSRQSGYLEYEIPVGESSSVLLAHVLGVSPRGQPDPREYVCFAAVENTGNRRSVALECDLASTLAFLMAAPTIGRSGTSPFTDIAARFPGWSDLYAARRTDLLAFLLAAFGTVHNALASMAPDRFDPRYQSLRPVMETIIARALEQYRSTGALTAAELVAIANRVTGDELPLARLLRFPDVYSALVTLTDVPLQAETGTLTKRSTVVRPPTLQSEVDRFFLDRSPLEMADSRTYAVQNLGHRLRSDGVELTWTPLPHVDGYNVYLDRVLVGWTRRAAWLLPRDASGDVAVRAVGQAGEMDGTRYTLDPIALAQVSE
jgi:hypothetical protein